MHAARLELSDRYVAVYASTSNRLAGINLCLYSIVTIMIRDTQSWRWWGRGAAAEGANTLFGDSLILMRFRLFKCYRFNRDNSFAVRRRIYSDLLTVPQMDMDNAPAVSQDQIVHIRT
jgi:hypothetical protein